MSKLELVGTVIFKDEMRVQIYRTDRADTFVRRETLPTEIDKEDGRIIFAHSRYDTINRFGASAYAEDYFRRPLENCWCELRTL